jgi:hypothetical protein
MDRYRSYGAQDDQPAQVGDNSLLGVDEYNAPENIRPGNVQNAVNVDFSPQDATTRGGLVCMPELGNEPFGYKLSNSDIGASSTAVRDGVYAGGYYVMAGYSGNIWVSTDGVTWSASISPYSAQSVRSVAYGGTTTKYWVAVGDKVLTGGYYKSISRTTAPSMTPTVWTASNLTAQESYSDICFGNNLWVAVGSTAVAYSSDALDWTESTANGFTSVAYGNGLFVAVSGYGTYYSKDGTTWTLGTNFSVPFIADGYTGSFSKVRFGNGRFVAITNGQHPQYVYSDDGVNFEYAPFNLADPYNWNLNALAYGNGLWVVAGAAGSTRKVWVSTEGTGWQAVSIPAAAAGDYFGAVYGDNKFIFSGDSNAGMTLNWHGAATFASGLFSDPNDPSQVWIVLAGYDRVGFYSNGRTSKSISYAAGEYLTTQGTIVQANNQIYLFRGVDQKPLYWDGNWNGTFALVPDTTLPASFNSIPNSNQATFYQNRLWVVDGKDDIAASDVLSFTDYDPLANELSTNTGNSDYVVATFPFGQNSLIAFKNKSIQLLQNCEGGLSDVTTTEITRQVGLIGINAVCSVGPDLAYASYGNINLLTLTSTNNSLQHKTLPLSAKVKKIMERVNWQAGTKISMGYWSNRLYVAMPLDNSERCNALIVYNFITENWYGEWNFDALMSMNVQGFQVIDYLGLQRLHAISEDGRIFVTDEGYQDISGSTLAEISYDLTTRAYDTSNLIHFQRRMFMDIGTIRPSFSVYSYTEGANEVSTLIEDQTYSRSESWKFADSDYDLTNANDDYNRPYRKDYSSGPLAAGSTSGLPATGLQCGSGFQPEMYQEYRFPLLTRRQGRLTWLQLTNAQGYLKLMSIGAEARMGQRSSLVTV